MRDKERGREKKLWRQGVIEESREGRKGRGRVGEGGKEIAYKTKIELEQGKHLFKGAEHGFVFIDLLYSFALY